MVVTGDHVLCPKVKVGPKVKSFFALKEACIAFSDAVGKYALTEDYAGHC